MTTTLNLKRLKLFVGKHNSRNDGVCAMEAAAWLAGEAHTDKPACVDPAITSFVRYINDIMPSSDRQRLKPYLKKMIGTRTDNLSIIRRRAFIAADFAVRVAAPWALDSAGLKTEATKLRALPEVDSSSAESAIRRAASAAWSAALAAENADSASMSAANAAWSARSAVRIAAENAARSAENAAENAAWSARSAAASAENAARSAENAENAAWSAVLVAESAAFWRRATPILLDVLKRMIEVKP